MSGVEHAAKGTEMKSRRTITAVVATVLLSLGCELYADHYKVRAHFRPNGDGSGKYGYFVEVDLISVKDRGGPTVEHILNVPETFKLGCERGKPSRLKMNYGTQEGVFDVTINLSVPKDNPSGQRDDPIQIVECNVLVEKGDAVVCSTESKFFTPAAIKKKE
jgi:hypothetical protein